jgi:hypothetical protein
VDGFPEMARVVFRCASDEIEPPRAHAVEGDKSDGERIVVEASEEELRALLTQAKPMR